MGVLRISISVSAGFTRLIAVGVFRRIFRRAKALWLPKGRGRPSVGEDVVELIQMSGYKLPSGLITDNDGIFGKWMEHDFLRYFDIVVWRTPPGQPLYKKWCNGICERFHRSLKSEVLNRVSPWTLLVFDDCPFAIRNILTDAVRTKEAWKFWRCQACRQWCAGVATGFWKWLPNLLWS